jgi:hypothetical protein
MMPIVFVHGVATRDTAKSYKPWLEGVRVFLREKIAPVISSRPNDVWIQDAYWGGLGVTFAWEGRSRPRSLLGQGTGQNGPSTSAQSIAAASQPTAFEGAPSDSAQSKPTRGLLLKTSDPAPASRATVRVRELTDDQLSDLAATALRSAVDDPARRAIAAIAADELAHDGPARRQLASQPTAEAELELLNTLLADRVAVLVKRQSGLTGMGAPGWMTSFKESLGEALSRTNGAPGYVLTKALGELRRPANEFVTLFLGDVFQYLTQRGKPAEPGPVPRKVLDVLKSARATVPVNKEPMIVLSHSMGGQIVYDIVTSFLPNDQDGQSLRVDFWCATASQVGLFLEMRQFLDKHADYGSNLTKKKIPFPDKHYLGAWWNVWDPNDFISYTVRDIIEGVDDEPYDSGMSIIHAHGGYLERPSFYNRLAEKIKRAKSRNWM